MASVLARLLAHYYFVLQDAYKIGVHSMLGSIKQKNGGWSSW